MAIVFIAKLYARESATKDESPEHKYRARQEQAVPQFAKIRQWLDKTLHLTLPEGLLGKALSYLEKNWAKLTVYTQDGRLAIDNNGAENAIRPFVVGRKKLAVRRQRRQGQRYHYSLIETAKANRQEPYTYLRHLFTGLPSAPSVDDIKALLSWHDKVQGGVN